MEHNKILNIGIAIYTIVQIAVMSLAFVFADSLAFKMFMALYFIVYISSFVLASIQNKKIPNFLEMRFWFVISVIVWTIAYNLFESNLGYFQVVSIGSVIVHGFILLILVASIIYGNLLERTGYISAILCLAGFMAIYFDWIPTEYISAVFISSVMVAFASVAILAYNCLRDFFKLESALSVVMIMFIIKAFVICPYSNQFLNDYGIVYV